MASISTAVELTDRMTYPLHSITSALNSTLNVFDDFKSSLGDSFDNTKIDAARRSIDEANASIDAMNESMNGASNGSKNYKNNLEDATNQQQYFNNSLNEGTTASGSFIKSLMGFSVIQKLVGLVSSQVDSAIDRLDTMNNYPKVMSNLGIGTDQANASIQVLSEKLKGLPTTLNDAVSSVQNFTSVNDSVGKSTKMFLALNNAILAGGGSTQVQQSALEQLSQAYAKGKPDMMEWRTAMTAMPAQLKQVAQAMGYVSANKLGEDLRAGKVSMDDFMDTFIQLNEQGTGEFQSFEEQARNATGGFATSIANMKSAVTRGITSMIDSVNNALTSAGFGTIQTIIQNVGSGIENMLKKIGNTAGKMISFLSPALHLIQQVGSFISENWSIIAPIIGGITTALVLYNTALGVHAAYVGISTLLEGLHTIATYNQAQALLANVNMTLLATSTEYALAVATAQATVAQTGFNTALLASPITWILLIIIAIIAAIYAVVAVINKVTGSSISATGVIVGALMSAVAFIWNLFLSLLDLVLGVINAMVNPWIAFANFFANLFNDPIGAIVHLFGDMADSILGILETIAKAIDKVFGSNLSGAVQGWRSGLNGMVEKVANQYGNGSYEKVAEELNLSSESLGLSRWAYSDAYSTGYSWGEGIENSLSSALDTSMGDYDLDSLTSTASDISDTADNTSKINSTLSASEEDLKYLRDLAEQETVNRFTTAEITVNQTNHNNINSDMDIDGVVDSLTTGVNEAMEKAAEGVHE
jgi:tape measure domain-containing protein